MSGHRGGEILVLHVDDEPGFAEMAATYLEREREGVTVETATSVTAALAVLEERGVDCVVSDYDMPDRNGLDLLRAVRERYGDVPFVLFTGKGSEEIASEAISAGVDDYLQKEAATDTYTILANRVENLVTQQRATDAAARSEERYHNLVDTSPASVGLFDASGELVYANDAAADLLGYDDPEAMVGTPMPEFVHPDDRERAVERFRRIHEDGATAPETEMKLVTKGGAVRHVRIASTPGIYRGEPVAQAVLEDVTPLREAATGGTTDRGLVRQALDTLDDVFYILDADGAVQVWNERATAVTGLADEDLGEVDPIEVVVDEDADRVVESIQEALDTGSSVVEARLETAGDDVVPYEFRSQRLTDESGEVRGVAGIGRDVSQRQRREQALRALNDFAADISGYDDPEAVCERAVEAAEAVLSFDRCVVNLEDDGVLSAAAVSSGLSSEEVAEMTVEEGLVGLTYREGETSVVDDVDAHDAAAPQGPYGSALSIPMGDHGVFQAVDDEVGAFDGTDRELSELLVAHCESALDRIEQAATLKRQNESLEEFATIVSHDLRNPLNLMQTSVDLARETGESHHLDDCESAIETMEELIEDLLRLAREGQAVEGVEAVAVHELARECWSTVGPEGATLTTDGPVTVAADPDRLRQVLENLLGNAVEHAGEDVTVEVGGLDDGEGFYVADDGPGIPAGRVDRVFEPGFTTSEDGTGFGLRIVREMVEAHGWTVEVVDSAAGGARFEIRNGP